MSKRKHKAKPVFEEGSGNVFADIGCSNPEEKLVAAAEQLEQVLFGRIVWDALMGAPASVVHDEIRYPDNWPPDSRHCDRCPGPQPDWNVHPELRPGARKPCPHCNGSGVVPAALDIWPALANALANLMWPIDRVDALRAWLGPQDTLRVCRALSVEVETLAGEVRVFFRYPREGGRT